MNKEIQSQLALEVVLAEYTARTTEVRNRSTNQSTLLQIHITAITIILGGVFTQTFGLWLVFLIPIEASLFGLWWIDHSLVIMDNATDISSSIEPKISKLLQQNKLLGGEARTIVSVATSREKRSAKYHELIFITFALPTIASLLCSSTILILNFAGSLKTKLFDSELSLLTAAACLITNVIFFLLFMEMFLYRRKLANAQNCRP